MRDKKPFVSLFFIVLTFFLKVVYLACYAAKAFNECAMFMLTP